MASNRIITATPSWEYYIVARADDSATGNVYLATDLVYRCDLVIDREDHGIGPEGDIPDEVLVEELQGNFARTLWRVLYDAQDPKERGQ